MPALSQNLTFHTTSGTNTVVVDYPNTGTGVLVYLSDKAKGDGYFGGSDGFHTVAFNTNQYFVGTASIQASLASEPVETDWFDVTDANTVYTALDVRTQSTVDVANFTGNFVWVRGKVSIEAGTLMAIQYNH